MLRRVRLCHGILSVCPSLLSIKFRYGDNIGWNSSKILSRPNSLRPVLGADSNLGDLVQWEHLQNWGGIGLGSPSGTKNLQYLQLLYVLSYDQLQQKTVSNFGKSSHWCSQRLPKLSRAYRAHRAVTFALAWLSCFIS